MSGSVGKAVMGVTVCAVATALVFGLLVVSAAGGGAPGMPPGSSGGSGTTGTLDATKVPPDYLAWVQKAGVCDAVPGALSPQVIAAQIEAESNWDPTAVSKGVGAQGISQFMPATWKTWGKDENGDGDGGNPFDPADAIMAQGRYDCYLAGEVQNYVKAGQASGDITDLMLAAYNAGPYAVKYSHGVPPYTETLGYVQKIRGLISKYTVPPAGGGAFGDQIVTAARAKLNLPYVWGGGDEHGPTGGGYDCSGLVLYAVYQASGGKIDLPHLSEEQVTMGTAVERNDMKPGDVIGFDLHHNGDYDHIGIYIGNHQMIHAPHTGDVVKVATLDWYESFPWKVRRFG
ncbi:NlpC/P60 family protein [Streptomyces sp. SP17BM10]|uniref:C40 family peptidase n=1 Tax=Streptomyces sp. SP17BM10 TaxID=3002530 RepID=UPI002E7A8C6A|nr:NlpC/P60 family protein [Streptomyces sp. SP17BM10]MEE1782687.1 NlpC/P60 family protein [Streptomyces sp. SP17BM10]